MAGPFVSRDYELAAQLEAVFGTSPGAVVGADFFKSQTEFPFKRNVARYNRDKDRDNAQRSVLTTQKGRESGNWEVKGDLIPAGAGTPTKPDMDLFFEAHMGTAHLCAAHTTTAAGSSGTTLNLTGGGGAASGILAGDLIAVDIDGAGTYEVRQVITIATDTVTIDRAFTSNPAAGRAVKTGVTFRLSTAQKKTLHLWQWLNGDNIRHKMGGCIVQKLGVDINFAEDTPVGGLTLSGKGIQVVTHSTARPTPVTVGQPLLPSIGKVYIGASGLLAIVKASLQSDNGLELRESDSGSLLPSAAKETGNGGRYDCTQALDLLLTTGTIEGYYDGATTLTAYDVIVQLGNTPSQIFAWRTPKFIPDSDLSVVEGEVAVSLSGKLYGGAGVGGVDDEWTCAFL